MDYQWYPGHMTKARRMMQENLKLVDLIIEIIDSRVPLSSRNPDIDAMANGKSRILIMGKADLADPVKLDQFKKYFEAQGFTVIAIDSREKKATNQIRAGIEKACRAKIERDRKRGIKNRPLRAMICGIPNVGKSTFINSLAGRASAKTGNKPGVTKGKQWITLKLGTMTLELLDTPGILWPKFEDQVVGVKLAIAGSIREEILDEEDLAMRLLRYLLTDYPALLNTKYAAEGQDLTQIGLSPAAERDIILTQADVAAPDAEDETPNPKKAAMAFTGEWTEAKLLAVLKAIAENRGHLLKGEGVDLHRTEHMLLDDFKNGRVGRCTLDEVPQ